MKKFISAWLSIFTVFLFLQSNVLAATGNEIVWQTYDKSVFEKAKKDKRPILLFVKADWCPHCKKMKETTLLDPGVVKLVNDSFIPVMIDADSDGELVKKYKVTGLPDFIILNGQDVIIKQFSGEFPIVDFMKNLSQGYRDFEKVKA